MELPNPPWYRRWSVLLAGVIGVAAVAALFGVLGFRGADPGPDLPILAPTTTVTTIAVAPPTTTSRPPATEPDGILWHETGHDNGKSPGIRTESAWHIDWSFDCSNFKSHGAGNFKITGDSDFNGIDIQSVEIEDSGSHSYRVRGYGHLVVESVCDRWTVTAVAD